MTEKTRRSMSLSTQVLLGFTLGAGMGVFLGDLAQVFNVFGQAFVGLLQMTVLPYVVVSLIAGLGCLNPRQAGKLALNGGLVLALISAIGIVLVLIFPLAFPDWKSASFFSTALVEEQKPFDFLSLYVPVNPFHSLANGVVPAVVLFCFALGSALMSVKDKERIIGDLSTLADALMHVAQFISRLSPYGVFAIVANASGTYELSDFNKIQVYVLTHTAIAILATFIILPGLVSALTSIRYRDVIRGSWGALLTAFATGNLLVVLPLLADESKRLLSEVKVEGEEAETAVDVLVPASFNFPNLGKLLSLTFVLFGGWFIGSDVPLSRYLEFAVTGFFTFFGATITAILFLLNKLQLPVDLIDLFIAVDVIASRFGTMVAAMNVMVLALLGGCAMGGVLVVRSRRILRYAAVSTVAVIVTLIGIRVFFTYAAQPDYEGYRNLVDMKLLNAPASAASQQLKLLPARDLAAELPTLDRIRKRNSLRICFSRDRLPFAFVNTSGQVVGLDIELMHILAKQLGVSPVLARIDTSLAAQFLKEGKCDIIAGGVPMTPEYLASASFSKPYMDENIAFVVRDHLRAEFSDRDEIKSREQLRIGVPNLPYYVDRLQQYLPQAEIVLLDSPRIFFRDKSEELDALVFTAEAGSAWSLVYPDFSVVVPKPDIVAVPLVFLVKAGDRDMVDYINVTIDLNTKNGVMRKLQEYWIQGKQTESKEPRWSVIRNVLHWVD